MKHFKTKKEAIAFIGSSSTLKLFKKKKKQTKVV